MAKSSGRFPKIASPDFAMMSETLSGSHEKCALPTPSRMPATGSTETGSIMHLPIFCMSENAFLKSSMSGLAAFRFGIEVRHQRAHVGSGIGGARAFGGLLALVEAKGAELRFHSRARRQADAECMRANAEQHTDNDRIAR